MSTFTLSTAFHLQPQKELIAFVGGGGKTSLLFALGAALPGRRLLTTTTRIFAAQMDRAQELIFATENTEENEKNIRAALDRANICLVVGEVAGDKAVGVSPELPGRWMAWSDVDFVLVEADGSRMRPIKAPAEHEPVIPPETTLVVPVVGIDALNGRFSQVTHRPEIAAELLNWSVFSDQLSASDVAQLIAHPQGGLKDVPAGARVVPFINKVETAVQLHAARQIAHQLLQTSRIERVIIGAMKLAQPVLEVHQRVTAVILAAGRGKRMGQQTKQLLPWGSSTVLGQTIANVQQTDVHNHLVITGHEAEAVTHIAQAAGVQTVHNPDFATGEMISSLQTAVRALDESVTAVLVVLADQPMIESQTMDLLLEAYWQGHSDLIAPVFAGKRGNPVLIGRRYFDELLALPPTDAPRTLLRRHADKLHLVEVPTDAILRDLDDPQQYAREQKRWGES
ncbi:MAG: putative selenium-dependent hydroxylase accessory protein YqeC [Ardenticatenaceae bacterium]|nr:putative selenium-dependent hydroxylase accessory protein YqeC [Ardenticatenaceae bacterium]